MIATIFLDSIARFKLIIGTIIADYSTTVLIGYYDYHLMTNIGYSDYFPNSQFQMHCLGKILPNDNYCLMTIFLRCPEVVIISDTHCSSDRDTGFIPHANSRFISLIWDGTGYKN